MNKPRKINKFGKIPINARITIDYSGKKPKITFGYIAQKEQRTLIYNNPFALLCALGTLIIFAYFFTYYVHTDDRAPLMGTCGIYEQYLVNSTEVYAYNITCENESYLFEYHQGVGIYPLGTLAGFYASNSNSQNWMTIPFLKMNEQPLYLRTILSLIFIIVVCLIMFLMIMSIFALTTVYGWILSKIPYVNKQVNKHTPELAKKMTWPRYMATFKKCPLNKIIEIPLFHNVFLDYDTGNPNTEFSRYLQRVEIREHPFDRLVKKSGFFKRQKQKYKKKHNISLWKARFIFKEVPKTGKLEVRWA
jgi:hypothetical protein